MFKIKDWWSSQGNKVEKDDFTKLGSLSCKTYGPPTISISDLGVNPENLKKIAQKHNKNK